MRLRYRPRQHASFGFALFLFLTASAGAAVAYSRMLERNAGEQLFAQGMPLGTRTLTVLSGGRCIGEVAFTLKRDDEKMVFEGGGELRATYKGQPFNTRLSMSSQFNSLQQLVAMVFTAETNGVRVLLGLENINPITVTLRIRQPDTSELRHSAQLPGPVMLREVETGIYTAVYPRIRSLRADGLLAQMSFLQAYDLHVAAAETAGVDCASPPAAFDVTGAIEILRRFAGQAQQLLNLRALSWEQTS